MFYSMLTAVSILAYSNVLGLKPSLKSSVISHHLPGRIARSLIYLDFNLPANTHLRCVFATSIPVFSCVDPNAPESSFGTSDLFVICLKCVII